MSDNLPPQPESPAEAGIPTTVTNISGGVNINAQGDVNIDGDGVGRDKTTTNIDTGGGAYVAGSVNVASGGEFVGRDKTTGFDQRGQQVGSQINVAGDYIAAPVPAVSSLHQLPPPPPDFTGRDAELTELLAKFDQGVTISGLQGQGGIGKTALALKLAAQLIDRYPDAQIVIDLKGVSDSPLSAGEIMGHVIRSFQPTVRLPDTEAELMDAYRTVLFNRRVLLLLDNARDAEQIKPLLPPPPGCGLIVTSRLHFYVPGLFAQNLEALPAHDARDLLLKIAPRINGQAGILAKLCGYLPLALRLAGSALAERRTLTPVDYLQRLEDAQTRLELVEASLSLSYDLLSEDLQQAWCALAVFPDTFDLAAAAAVWEIEKNPAQDRLDELVRYSLVDWNETAQRARLHDLARLFANKRLGTTARMDRQRWYATHYQAMSATANSLYKQGGERVKQGLALFDQEWTNIQTGQAWAVQNADTDKQALSLCDDYPAQCAYILFLRQHPRERIHWLETALIAARKLARKESEGWHLGNLGVAYYSLGEYRRAIEYNEQYLTIARAIGDRQGEGTTLGNLGIAHHSLGEYRRAIEYHEQSLTIARAIGDRLGEGAALGNLGLAYYSLGEYRRAIEYHEQSLTIARAIGDRLGEGHALGNLSLAYHSLGEYRRAIEYLEQRLTIARAIGDRLGEGHALGNLGVAYRNLGEYRRAIEYHGQSLTIKREIGDRLGEGVSINNLGEAEAASNNFDEAIEFYEKALSIFRELDARSNAAETLFSMGLALYDRGNIPQAILYAEESLDLYQETEDPRAEKVHQQLAQWRGQK